MFELSKIAHGDRLRAFCCMYKLAQSTAIAMRACWRDCAAAITTTASVGAKWG